MIRNDNVTPISHLKQAVHEFVHERDWERYHNPKDLAESICIEAAELLQLFQWITPRDSERFKIQTKKIQRVKEELADVLLYCLSMANTLEVDVTEAVLAKLAQNRMKYPVDIYRGKAYLDP